MKVIDMAVHEVATITADKTICDCARQMRLEHVGSLVVVNDDQTPLGMITDRDIAIEVVARNLDPMKLTVRDVMTTPVVTAGPSESMVVALARMREFGVRRLPIVDEEGKLVGVISNSNLVEELSSLLDSLGYTWNHKLNGNQALLLLIISASWKQISYNFLFCRFRTLFGTVFFSIQDVSHGTILRESCRSLPLLHFP